MAKHLISISTPISVDIWLVKKHVHCLNGGGGNFATLPCCQVDTFCAFYEHRQGPLGQFIEVWLLWKRTCSRKFARIASKLFSEEIWWKILLLQIMATNLTSISTQISVDIRLVACTAKMDKDLTYPERCCHDAEKFCAFYESTLVP